MNVLIQHLKETHSYALQSDCGQKRNLLMRVGIKLFSQRNRSRRNNKTRFFSFFAQRKDIFIQENVSFTQKFLIALLTLQSPSDKVKLPGC